jgi:hypothetical protein
MPYQNVTPNPFGITNPMVIGTSVNGTHGTKDSLIQSTNRDITAAIQFPGFSGPEALSKIY